MARAGKGKKKTGAINVNLSDVETSKVVPEGQYRVRLDKATVEVSNNSGENYIKFEFVTPDNSRLYHNASLQPQALFNLKAVLEALGFEIPSKAFDLELEELIGLECEVSVAHETYEGKKKVRITEFINLDADSEEDEDETDYADMTLAELKEVADEKKLDYKKAIKGKKDKEAKQILLDMLEDEEDEEEEMDYDEMSLEELIEECEDRGIKVPKKAKKPALIELLEEDDEE